MSQRMKPEQSYELGRLLKGALPEGLTMAQAHALLHGSDQITELVAEAVQRAADELMFFTLGGRRYQLVSPNTGPHHTYPYFHSLQSLLDEDAALLRTPEDLEEIRTAGSELPEWLSGHQLIFLDAPLDDREDVVLVLHFAGKGDREVWSWKSWPVKREDIVTANTLLIRRL
jgi:hypothetical protein